MPDENKRQQIADELERLEESARDSGQGQFAQASRWRRLNFSLGVPTSALAAAAGATGLASTAGRLVAGILALAAAVTGSVLTTFNASQRWSNAAAAANAYLEIQTAARQLRLIDLPETDLDEARQSLAELTARRDEQNKTAELIAPRAWKQAQKGLKAGSQTYKIDAPSGS